MRACAYLTKRVILSEAKNPLNKYEILRHFVPQNDTSSTADAVPLLLKEKA